MAQLKPVDYDPFAQNQAQRTLKPVDFDPFAGGQNEAPQGAGNVGRFANPAIGAADPANAPPYATVGDAAVGAAKAFGTGVLKGAVGLGTLPGNLEVLGRAGVNSLAGMVGVQPPLSPQAVNPITYNSLMERIEGRFGELPKPKTTAEKYIGTIGEFAPTAGLNPGSLVSKAAGVVAPAVASEAAGQATEGTRLEPYARVAGALAGGTLANVGARTVSPAGAVDPIRARNVKELERQGVDKLLAGQRTGNQRIQALEDASITLPGGGRTSQITTQQLEKFTGKALENIGVDSAALRSLGLNNARVTDEVLDFAAKKIGSRFEGVGRVARVVPDSQFPTRLQGVVDRYINKTSQGNRVPAVEAYAKEIIQEAKKPGGMNGTKYLAIRSALRADQRTGDGPFRDAVGRLVEQLDAQMIKTAPANMRADVSKFIQDNNRMWRDYLAIEKAARSQGPISSAGLLSPQVLNSAIKQQSKNLVSRNNRELGKLARAGDDVLRPMKSSGTAERNQAISMLKSPSSVASGLVGGALTGGDPLMTAMSWAAPMAIQAASARGITNPILQRYLSNQMLPGRVGTEASRSGARLMAPMLLTRDDIGPQPDPVALGRLLSTQR